MKVKNIKRVGKKPVYDLSVNSDIYDDQHYVLENGIITHNTGVYYSADNIYIIGRQQEKDGTELTGYNFIINVEKSRYVREKSKIPVSVSFEGGISKWSGLLDIALDGGFVVKPSNGWYQKKDETTKYRLKDTNTKEFWQSIIESEEFNDYIEKKYRISGVMSSDITDADIAGEYEDA